MLALVSLLLSVPLIFGFQAGVSSRFSHAAQLKSSSSSSSSISVYPKLIVFDLDHTLWTPELYTLRHLERANVQPIAGKEVKLFPGAQQVMERIRDNNNNKQEFLLPNTRFAVASRTKSVAWAHDLLQQFGIRDLFDHVEIYPGDKKSHFVKLQQKSGVAYQDMLFFDDARDGKYGNCESVSSMGVLSVHCANGLDKMDVFTTALQRFQEWDKSPNTIVESNGSVTTIGSTSITTRATATTNNANAKAPRGTVVAGGERQTGTVKMFNVEKGFGFIQSGDSTSTSTSAISSKTKDLFFHVNNLRDGTDIMVETGQELTFLVTRDSRNGNTKATDIIQIQRATDNDENSPTTNNNNDTVPIHAFSMNMPFAALLANGYKDLESRNGTMFVPYPAGTQMLLHVGRRIYPDGNKHVQVMKSGGGADADANVGGAGAGGLSDGEIEALKSLPPGFRRCGQAVAICELGNTYETTIEQRSDPVFQRRVAAFGADSGRMVTEIKKVAYLKRPVKVSGQGGVFKVQISPNDDVLPDGWVLTSSSLSSPKTKTNLPKTKYSTKKTNSTNEEPLSSSSSSKTTQPVYSIYG